MKKISAEIVADSVNEHGNRITTMLLTYPRFIHGELLTHRMFSRNSASSRAIPFEKMYKMIAEDPFIPIAWQKDHKGMQGTEYFTKEINDDYDEIYILRQEWIYARDKALDSATYLHSRGLSKQICNRLLEPFMWHTVLVTATEWNNFLELRCPKYTFNANLGDGDKNYVFKSKKDTLEWFDKHIGIEHEKPKDLFSWLKINKSAAEIHIQTLAESMWDAMNESTPKKLQAGEWHIPFGDKINDKHFTIFKSNLWKNKQAPTNGHNNLIIKIATARAARQSYMTFDGEIDYEKDIKLHDKLLADGHMSPFEHCARAMSDEEYFCHHKGMVEGEFDCHSEIGSFFRILEEPKFMSDKRNGWCNNFRGFIQYRYMIENNIQL